MLVIACSVRVSVQRPEDVALQSMRVTVVGDHLCVVVKHCKELWQVSDIDLHRRDGKDCTETQDCRRPPMSSLSTLLSSNHAGCALAASWRSLLGFLKIPIVYARFAYTFKPTLPGNGGPREQDRSCIAYEGSCTAGKGEDFDR